MTTEEVTKIMYIAFDGTKFEKEVECLKYERNHEILFKNIHLYTEDFEECDYLSFENFEDCFLDSNYIFIKIDNEKSLQFLKSLIAELECNFFETSFNQAGIYIYNRDFDNWINIENILSEYVNNIKNLKNIKKVLTNK